MLPPYFKEEALSQVTHMYTNTHLCGVFFSSSVLFTGQRVSTAVVTFLQEASVTGGLITINFHAGRGDFCKEGARRIRNVPGQHLFSGLANKTENLCSVCVFVSEMEVWFKECEWFRYSQDLQLSNLKSLFSSPPKVLLQASCYF